MTTLPSIRTFSTRVTADIPLRVGWFSHQIADKGRGELECQGWGGMIAGVGWGGVSNSLHADERSELRWRRREEAEEEGGGRREEVEIEWRREINLSRVGGGRRREREKRRGEGEERT
eukprot:759851-Hanusia_phi.AAC.4